MPGTCRFALLLMFLSTGLLSAAEPNIETYAEAIDSEPDLMAWWRFENDLEDAKGSLDGKPLGGEPRFAEGPSGGKALLLGNGRYATFGNSPQLDLNETTVELWFRLDFEGILYNPCLLAKRVDGDHRQTRWSLHAWADYTCVAVWNGRQVMKYLAADGPLVRGRWYHLAVTSTPQQMRVYLDGVPCSLDGPNDTFRVDVPNTPLSIGSSQPKGAELIDATLDEVAVYNKALTEEAIAKHVDAMGFQDRRMKLAALRIKQIEEAKQLRAKALAEREKHRATLLDDPALFARGKPAVYQGDYLKSISLSLSGIGTGSIQIDGTAVRRIWQIFNNHKHAFVPNSFFAVRTKTADGEPVVRALQTEPVGPIAPVKSLTFRGEYPFGWYAFDAPELGVKVSMEAFNPLVPLEARNSSIPCAVFRLTAENPTEKSIEVSFLATQQNAVGYLGDKPIEGRKYANYGGNRNEVIRHDASTVLHLSTEKARKTAGFGGMALIAMGDRITGNASWESIPELVNDFSTNGDLTEANEAGPSPSGETLDGALCVRFSLNPGEKRTVPFVLAWHFPNAHHGSPGWGGKGNRYTAFWPDVTSVVGDLEENLDTLTTKTRAYHDALYASNLPYWLVDRIGSQVAVLRSKTCFWTEEGYFGGWEGCRTSNGCCHGNCNHVWHYAQAHGRLFPSVGRLMRSQEFRYQSPNGAIPHRQPKSFPAFDGQCGAVLNSYREHLMSTDGTWLDENWPSIRRATEFLITTWDKDEDGVLAGAQWNTLDGALGGSSSWLGSLYLAALAAAEKMALEQDASDLAERYTRIRRSGSKKQDETLFNGEYYIQIPEARPHEDYGNGCHIDQVLGQWWADQLDLGSVYPPDRVRTALASLFRYNFRGRLEGLPQRPRKFVADFDPGMQMIVWPKGDRPSKVIRYGDEVMTGFEYSAAAAMVASGLMREGFTVARAVGTRYDGRLRTELTPSDHASWGYSGNPFGDDECGKFYARAMSVWSMLLVTQGSIYDGPAGRIGFKPRWRPEDHVSFFTAAEGWGVFTQKRSEGIQTERIEPRYGRLRIRSLVFETTNPTEKVDVRHQNDEVPVRFETTGDEIRIMLDEPILLEAGQELSVTLR